MFLGIMVTVQWSIIKIFNNNVWSQCWNHTTLGKSPIYTLSIKCIYVDLKCTYYSSNVYVSIYKIFIKCVYVHFKYTYWLSNMYVAKCKYTNYARPMIYLRSGGLCFLTAPYNVIHYATRGEPSPALCGSRPRWAGQRLVARGTSNPFDESQSSSLTN